MHENSHTHSVTRSGWKWLAREEDRLFEICMGSLEDCTIYVLASKMQRSPLEIARHVLESDITEMLGFDAPTGSEEEVEFLGLTLSGVPLQAALRWCTADESRPTAAALSAMMTHSDMRPALELARLTGMWICRPADVEVLSLLALQPLAEVQRAVQEVIDRFDVPTPSVVAGQMAGVFDGADQFAYPWGVQPTSGKRSSRSRKTPASTARTRRAPARARPRKFSSDKARRRYWAERNAKRKSRT